jgi:RHS repeat-associated protein
VSVRRRASGRVHYNYFRDYDPAVGRYVQSDPIGLDGGINTFAYAGGDTIAKIDPLGLEYGWAYSTDLRHMGWRPPTEPNSMGLVRPEVKAYLCKQIELCNGNLKCVFWRANEARKSDLKNRSWYNDTWREAENWAMTAAWNGWQSWPIFIDLHQVLKYVPFRRTTPPSAAAWSAGYSGRAHFGQTPEQLKEWCDGCSLH